MTVQRRNKELVRRTFDTWARTGGGILDVLAEDVRWTIVGSEPSGHTFHGRTAFLKGAFDPIAVRPAALAKPTA